MISYHTMVQSYIFLLVTVTSIIWKISLGLSCLSCHSESDKSRCSTHQVQCRDGFEECFFDKSTLQNSVVVYSAGCRAKAVCELLGNAVGKRDVLGRSRRTSVLCAQCCNTAPRNNIPCNAHLCDNRLFCLSCHSESDKSKCLTHQVECRDGLEECFFDKTTLQNSAVVYSAGCREKAVCDLVGNAVGKRDVISRSRRTSVLCAQCCNTPPSNSLPCNAQLCEDPFTPDTSTTPGISFVRYTGFTTDISTPGHFTDYNHNDCKDLINCRPYPKERICPANSSYHAWANVRCRMYCGFCIVSTPPSSCADKISNCNEYDADLCTNPLYRLFKEDNCQLFCGLCKTAATIPSTTPSTPVPTTTMKIPFKPPTTIDVFTTDTSTPGHFTDYNHNDCKDLINRRPYPKERICPANSSNHARANVRCRMYFGFCIASTPPRSFVDKICNCKEYDSDLCTNRLYRLFREDKCQQFCGLCKIAVSTPPPSCVDKISNCNEYDTEFHDLCTNPLYRLVIENNCHLFCGLCKIIDFNATLPSKARRDNEEEGIFFL